MPEMWFSLGAHLVIDNSVLVMLCEYCCERHVKGLPRREIVPTVAKWVANQLGILSRLSLDGNLYCTNCVAHEFKPQAGRLSRQHGIGFHDCQVLSWNVCSLLYLADTDPADTAFLRQLPDAPRKLMRPDGLSDNDLSLVLLALELAQARKPVYLLTNDDDLLSFVTWLRPRPAAVRRWKDIGRLQGLHSLTYFELAHRDCTIQTEQMEALTNFYMLEHYSRKELAGTGKGTSILLQLIEVRNSLTESVRIKATSQGALA